MKYRIFILTTLSLLTLSSVWAANDSKRKNVLSLKESITDNAIHYPSSFESDTKEMMESWYLKDFDFNSSYSSNTGTVSDRVYKERLQKLPTSIEMPFNQIVKSYIERYVVKGRTLVAQLVGMSSYYMPIFEAALERHNMPLELKYIPIIESALNPNAVSPAGAGGLWQFMPATAKGIGMEVTSQVDARRDPYVSSEKAAVFFQKLYDTYGDWSLAIAAYNCGPGNVNKAMKRVGTEHPDFWEIYNYLPKETRGYVPAFIAANYVMTYYREHGINPKRPDRPLIIDTVQINRRVSFSQISSVLKIPMEEIRILNPQYRGDVIPGNVHPYTLALPSQQIYSFIEEENKIYNNRRDSYDGGSQDFLQDHEVRDGEDVFAIADMYNMKIDDLLKLNKLESEYAQLEPGSIIKVMATSNRRNNNQQGYIASTGNKQYDDDDDNDDNYINSGDDEDELSKIYNSNPTKKNNSGGYYGNNNYNNNNYNNDESYNDRGHNGSDNRPVPERRKKSDYNSQGSQYNSGNSSYGSYSDDEDDYSEEVYQQELKRQQEEAARKKREAEAKKKREAEAKKKRDAEIAAKKKRDAEIAAKKKRDAELAEKKRKEEAEAKKRREEEERRRREAAQPINHKVKSGQNLTKLAQQYGTTPEAIRKANNIKGDNIREGQTLKIPKK